MIPGVSLAASLSTVLRRYRIPVTLAGSQQLRAATVAVPLGDQHAYLAGNVWKSVEQNHAGIVASGDSEDAIIRLTLIANMLRGRKEWDAARASLSLVPDATIARLGARAKGHMLSAKTALEFETGDLERAEHYGDSAWSLLSRAVAYDLDCRVMTSLAWKLSHIKKTLRKPDEAHRYLTRSETESLNVQDLHGYCNVKLAEAHQAVEVGSWTSAIEAILRVLHPPYKFRGAPRSAFIAAEAARAVAVLEAQFFEVIGRPLGLVHPSAALHFSEQVFKATTSEVMRVPYLADLAIAPPAELRASFESRLVGLPSVTGARPQFTPAERQRMFDRYRGICSLCGVPMSPTDFHVDHVVFHKWGQVSKRLSRPGFINFRPVHGQCNLLRGAKDGVPVAEHAFAALRSGMLGHLFLPDDETADVAEKSCDGS